MADQKKVIQALTDAIKLKEAELEKIAGDVARANDAVNEADQFQAQINEVSRKRAEAKALAFVDGRKADTAEFDRQEKELERLSKQAIEDSAAATIAIELLNAKSAAITQQISELDAQRKTAAVAWLAAYREASLDRYIKAIKELCDAAALAIAADGIIHSLQPRLGEGYFPVMLRELKEFDFPMPLHRHVEVPARPGARQSPARWNKFISPRGPEYGGLIEELQRLGVVNSRVVNLSSTEAQQP